MSQFEVLVPGGTSVDKKHALMPIRGTGGTTAAYAEVSETGGTTAADAEVSEDVMGPAAAGSEVVRESGPRFVARS